MAGLLVHDLVFLSAATLAAMKDEIKVEPTVYARDMLRVREKAVKSVVSKVCVTVAQKVFSRDEMMAVSKAVRLAEWKVDLLVVSLALKKVVLKAA